MSNGLGQVGGLAVNWLDDILYFSEPQTGVIKQLHLSTTDVSTLHTSLTVPGAITIQPQSRSV